MSDMLDLQYRDRRLVDIYDDFNEADHDFIFYAARLVAASRVLDVGAGTGRFSAKLSQMGHEVVAVEPSSAMLEAAKGQPGAEHVTWLQGGIATVPAGTRFDAVIMMGHAFQCLLTDAEVGAMLVRARGLLSQAEV